jgi:pimeloyl-ACP methyl ester carboxylesterase
MQLPTNRYFSVREYRTKNARKTLFLFPAGFTKLSYYRLAIWQLNRMGIDVVGFDFYWKKAAQEATIEGLKQLFVDVDFVASEYIKNSKNSFGVFGLSFGGAIAQYVAKRHEEINSTVLIVPHATMSKVLWTYKPTKRFIERLKKEGISSERALNKLFDDTEPQFQLELMKGKKIVIFTAFNDKIVTNGLELADNLKKIEPSAQSYTSRFGHFFGGVSGLLRKKKWEAVLRD